MTAPRLKLVSETREQRIERALRALMNIIADTSIPLEVRQACGIAHRELHPCRAPETVARMEHNQGLTE